MYLTRFSLLFLLLFCAEISIAQYKLWYSSPAKVWEEALPIGNGKLGAMIYGGIAEDEIQFNEETLWTGSPRDYNAKNAHQYLDSIRYLLEKGNQKQAEELAMNEFMGLKSETEDNGRWLKDVGEIRGKSDAPSAFRFEDSHWKNFTVPTYEGWESAGLEGLDGALWFRREFDLSKADLSKDWVLDLNRVRDIDYTYINGTFVGNTAGEAVKRGYKIPKNVLREGKNVIAIQVINLFGKGGIAGYKDTAQHIGLVDNEGLKHSLNGLWKYHVQDANPPKVGSYQASYQPFGMLKLSFPHETATDYKRVLNLDEGLAEVTYTARGVQYRRTYLTSFPDQAIGIRLAANKKKKVSFKLALGTKHAQHKIEKVDENTLSLTVNVKDGGLVGVSLVRIKLKNGTARIVDNMLEVKDADEAYVYLSAATNFVNYNDITGDGYKKAFAIQEKMANQSFDEFAQAHRKDYKHLYDRFAIDLGEQSQLTTDVRLTNFDKDVDPSFVALYVQYGRYLQISSSREGTQPANLQGVWNHQLEPSWGSKYTANINLEMNYWPTEVLNLRELHTPLFQMIRELQAAGTKTAKSYYNARGWVLHHNTDIWRGTAPINNSNHGIWPTGGAWLVTHLWEHYQFNQDPQFIADYYDIIKGATLFFKDVLVEDKSTGWLVSTPSNSPENGGLVKGPTMDHQIIRALFQIFVKSADLLDKDRGLRDSIMQMHAKIAPNQIGKYGQLQEWLEDKDDPENKHRHVSHLWGLHPGNEINEEATPALMDAAKQTLKMRGDEGTGWSLAWKINFWARLKDSEHTLNMIKMLLRPADSDGGSYPNLFDAHPPFQIDGNFGGAAGIAELFLQSHLSYIEILPALPERLAMGSIKGIKARGGFEVNMVWKDKTLRTLEVRSTAGKPLSLKYKGNAIQLNTEKGKTYTFDSSLKHVN
ncbi:glycoside hydrolase family 95 protein [Sphingobacterium pedocola]|uniref:glycoside hydrolase family 95 protein n=1 Tax=Sphingobacterium pedocola TaxID=2082722 RepID=UPI0018C93E54|nr:glycoside hydrolase N-terminal domain-containing protein [Sphingobacterium pedocola]